MNGALAAGLTGCLTAMTLGLTSGSAVADHVAVKSGADHSSLAETATNPLGSLVQFQMIDQYNWETYNSDGPSNVPLAGDACPGQLPGSVPGHRPGCPVARKRPGPV